MKIFLLLFILLAGFCRLYAQQDTFFPGKSWKDTDGNTINAHGGGLLFYKGVYYWFGEVKEGITGRVPYIFSWEAYRVAAGGINCYSSTDLFNWKYEGRAMAPNTTDTNNVLHTTKVIERPKVIYNKKTKQFVMWMHLDNESYTYARSGVAVSNKVTGPYTLISSQQPNGHDVRDMTIFQDDDDRAYHVYASENNASLHITLLTDDYLRHTKIEQRILISAFREAPAIIKHNKKYYLLTSGCTGWTPNAAAYAVADNLLGKWKQYGNPCIGMNAATTFSAQSTFILPIPRSNGNFIFLADRWNKTNLPDSRYVWVPMTIRNGKPVIRWADAWNFSTFPQ